MKKIHKFIIGGMLLVALTHAREFRIEQLSSIPAWFGVVIGGIIIGSIGYAIFGRENKK